MPNGALPEPALPDGALPDGGGIAARHAHTGKAVAATLRNSIVQGELPPGAKLSERRLGESLGVSRNTLREAFTRLSAERIIVRIPNRGVFVAAPQRADVEEMYAIRGILEPSALRRASPNSNATRLSDAVQAGLSARDRADVAGMAGANQNFHAEVVALAGSPRLNGLMSHIQAQSRLVFHSMANEPAFHEPFATRNASILHLWLAGEAEAAAKELENYLDQARVQVLAAMPSDEERKT